MAYENEEQVREALAKLRELSSDSALVDLMMREDFYEMDQIELREMAEEKGMREGMKKGLEKGMQEGLEKGLEEEKIETAKRMLKERMEIELIIKITQLPREEIEKIQAEIKEE